jgi:hypothetical protein
MKAILCLLSITAAVAIRTQGYPYNDDGTEGDDANLDDISLSLLNSELGSTSKTEAKAGAEVELTVDVGESVLEKTDQENALDEEAAAFVDSDESLNEAEA